MPGAVFHIYARTIGRAAWFDERVRDAIVEIIADSLRRTDARLLAFVVMPNHFHFVVQQGYDPLSRFMQPVCRRTALAVHRIRKRSGRIFERRFYARVCADARYVRAAIAYVHRNPLKRLCKDARDYAWSSHRCYSGEQPVDSDRFPAFPNVSPALSLFADQEGSVAGVAGYLSYMAWRAQCASCAPDEPRPPKPPTRYGDAIWETDYSRLVPPAKARQDLRDIVLRTLHEVAPGMTISELHGRCRGRTVLAVRREAIARSVLAGHRGVDIAGFLGISPSTVSRVAGDVWTKRSD